MRWRLLLVQMWRRRRRRGEKASAAVPFRCVSLGASGEDGGSLVLRQGEPVLQLQEVVVVVQPRRGRRRRRRRAGGGGEGRKVQERIVTGVLRRRLRRCRGMVEESG